MKNYLAALALVGMVAACAPPEEETVVEVEVEETTVAEDIEEAAEEAEEAMEEAADEMSEAAEDLAEETEEALEEPQQ